MDGGAIKSCIVTQPNKQIKNNSNDFIGRKLPRQGDSVAAWKSIMIYIYIYIHITTNVMITTILITSIRIAITIIIHTDAENNPAVQYQTYQICTIYGQTVDIVLITRQVYMRAQD